MMSEFKMYVFPQQFFFTGVTPGEIQPFILSQTPAGWMKNDMSDAPARQVPELSGWLGAYQMLSA